MSTGHVEHLDLPLTQSVLDDIPLPFHIYQADGRLIATNRRADQFWGIARDELVNKFNALENPESVTANFIKDFHEALNGKVVVAVPALVDTTQLGVAQHKDVQRWVGAIYFPLHDHSRTVTHVALMNIDFTDMVEREHIMQVSSATEDQEISAPAIPSVLQIWDGLLTVPLTGSLDSQQAMLITKSLLEAIVRNQTRVVIVDITGLPIDRAVVHYILSVERACRLLGSEVVLTGISSSAIQAFSENGVNTSNLVIKSNLRSGIAWAFDRLGYSIVRATRHTSVQPAS